MPEKTAISTSPNGPLVVRGIENLTERNGNIFSLKKRAIALCRYGKSKNKPFCDGQHWYSQFKDEEKALAQFKNFYTAINKELMVFARTIGVNDVHKFSITDVVTGSKVVADSTDIEHI
ncbi:MAG: hypothetical protein IEMM0006_1933 [bacterium]|nr:MAG: hypothetical protein IEMM0006_1933 [bacterium]